MPPLRVGSLEVPPLCLGASGLGNMGGAISDDVAMGTVRAAIEGAAARGSHAYIETSPAYGMGLSERRVGLAMANHPREETILQTKVGYHLRPIDPREAAVHAHDDDIHASGAAPFWMDWDFSGAGVRRQLDDSMQRLGTSVIDSVVIHGMDYAVADARKAAAAAGKDPDAAEEATKAQIEGPDGGLAVLQELQARGKIGAFGVALNEECPVFPSDAGARIAWSVAWFRRVLAAAAGAGAPQGSTGLGFVLAAGVYTLLDCSALESGLLDAAREAGVAVLAAAPFNSGILARAADDFDGATFSYAPAKRDVVERARALAEVCGKHGVALRAAALAFPLANDAVASVVVGAKSAAEWADCVALRDAGANAPPEFWAELRTRDLVPASAPLPGDDARTQ